ncbi:glycoside hydrolase family 55 protein [Kribbella sp. NBC_00709]|uniref:glycosyl hydrolase family 28-related protein n=1 Tax=Kribbella sp. NBC_00709 TaxID=2975972 RepID=UPI002E27FF9F|nr:glycosyl hydrolase family 28-related protein [Kribbella sp. NBC_00709]
MTSDPLPTLVAAVAGPSRRRVLGTSGAIVAGALAGGVPAGVWSPRPADARPTETAPVLYRRQVRSVSPGQVFGVSGAGFATAAQARVWPLRGRDANSAPAKPPHDARPLDVVGVTADAVVLRAPAGRIETAFAVYVSSGDGRAWSRPFVVNTPDPWYLDMPSASAGDEVTVYGNDLQVGLARPTVTLTRHGLTRSATVLKADRYQIRFEVPKGLNGDCTVQVSTGPAGARVTSSLRLPVVARAAAPRHEIDAVRDYGADPSGQQDSTAALQAALTAAAQARGGARVRIPAGTYTLTSKLRLPDGNGPIVVQGAGQDRTKLRMSAEVNWSTDLPRNAPTDMYAVDSADDYGMLYLAPGDTPTEVRGLGFDTNERRMVAIELDTRNNATIAQVTVENPLYPDDVWLYVGTFAIFGQNLRNLTIEQCDLHAGNGAFFVAVTDVRVQDNTFRLVYPRNPADPNNPEHQADNDGVKVWGGRRLTVRRNRFGRGSDEFYYARAVQTGALRLPSQVAGVEDACGIEDCYYGENLIVDAGQPAGNCGEALVGDQINSAQGGRRPLPVSAATSTTISTTLVEFVMDDAKLDPIGTTVIILAGTGIGQLRKVVANTATTLTLDEPWEVVPGTDSVFVVCATQQRELYVNNTIRSTPKYVGNYGASVLCIAAGNDFDSAGAVNANPPGFDWTGVSFISVMGGKDFPVIDVSFYNQVRDNRITGGLATLMYDDFTTLSPSLPPQPLMRGNVLAGNQVSNAASAVRLGTPYVINQPVGVMAELTVVTGNTGPGTVNTVQDIPWNHTVYDGPAGDFTDAGTNSIIA